METRNAIIKSARITTEDHGLLTVWIDLDYGGVLQGFGGFSLYLPKSFTHHKIESAAGHFIFRVMEIAGVGKWDALPGKAIRVKTDHTSIREIGHIIKEDWFCPREDFANL